jgi:ligand-binding SRPBCC domain-containing protein
MPAHYIKTVQKIPVPLERVWNFFAHHSNLEKITPPSMGFRIISHHHGELMYSGQIIEYTFKPLLGIPVYWMTGITQVKDNMYFIDKQIKGPYSLWHHQHHFKSIEGGVEMTDIVHYRIPLGFIGRIANSLFVKEKLRKVFEYRFNKTEEIFGKWKDQSFTIDIG